MYFLDMLTARYFRKIWEVDLVASKDRSPGDRSDAIQFATGSRTSDRGVIAAFGAKLQIH